MEGHLALIPVYAATRLISDAVASLPLQGFRKTSDGRVPIALPAALANAGQYGTRVDWLQRCMMSLLLRGNAYGMHTGTRIEWLHPDEVMWRNGQWFYKGERVEEAEMVHIPAMTLPGERLGLSPVSACSVTMRTGRETQVFMRDWFRNRAVPGMVFKNEAQVLDPDVAAATKERLLTTLRNGEPFVTGSDWSIDVLKLSADDAGFVGAARLNATQVANIFGVPPEMIGGETGTSMTYSTTEQQQIQFITHTLRPWLVRLEAAFSDLMPRPQYVKFNVDSLIRVDTKTRYEVHQIARNIGLNNTDELRDIEDLEPLPDGKGQDYTPLAASAPAAPTKENP